MFMKKEKWKRLLGFGVVSVALSALVACGGSESTGGSPTAEAEEDTPAPSGAVVDLSISSFMPGPHPQHTDLFEPFIEQVEEVTEGRVTGTMYPANALGESNAQYDLVVNGVADMSMALHGYTPGRFPLTGVTELPFMGGNAVESTEIFWNLHEQFPEIAEEHDGTKVAWLFKNDPAQLLTVDKPIQSPEDLNGLRIRTPSPAANGILEAYGAIPVSMPMGDVYEAMQRGVVDGALAPASVITNFQLADVTGYITKGDFYTSSLFVVINPNTWSQIAEEDQVAIEELMGEAMALKAGEIYDEDGEGGWNAAREGGIEIYEISDEELDTWKAPLEHLNEEWVEEMEAQGLPGQAIFDEAIRLRDQGE